jgi:hypothetical protein
MIGVHYMEEGGGVEYAACGERKPEKSRKAQPVNNLNVFVHGSWS